MPPASGETTHPTRTCVGCRVRADKPDLLRVVLVGDVCVPDVAARLPGRGAYLHRDPGCLDLALRRRSLVRALRAPAGVDVQGVREVLTAAGPEAANRPSTSREHPDEHPMNTPQ